MVKYHTVEDGGRTGHIQSTMYSWNFKDENKNSSYSTSPSSVGRGSPEEDSSDSEYESSQDPNNRRGRPRADAITTLIFKGAASMSHIRCNTCNRVFPREKSLQAHMRTHTGIIYLAR